MGYHEKRAKKYGYSIDIMKKNIPSHALILSIRQATWLPATFQRLFVLHQAPHQGKAHHAFTAFTRRSRDHAITGENGPKMGTVQVVFTKDIMYQN